MAAGLGFKTFTTGEVLTAADTNGYLMQGVLVFASAAARTSAITSPQEGQSSYLKDTNALEFYDGAAWTGAPVGDITAVTAGTGLSGGGSSGDVTVSINTAVTADLTTSQTLTNKTLTTPVIASISNGGTVTIPSGADTLVARTSTDTLTNKTLTSPVINSPKISSTYTAKTAAYTFASGDEGNLFSMNNAATQQFNIPTDATFNFAVGTEINVFWITGAGQPTIGAVTPGTTTVISTGATSATPKLRVANSGATCKKLAANSWIVFGDIS